MHRLKEMVGFCHKIVIKVGTNLLADKVSGLNKARINEIAKYVAYVKKLGRDVVIVSSGAIGAGVSALNLKEKPKTMPEKQAAAAVGQPLLMEAYENAFRIAGNDIAQILLTRDDFSNRSRYLNACNTFSALFKNNVIPIVNENDSVAVEEIKVGDNDNMSALVANLIGADLLVILTDIDGLYTDDPAKNKNAELIPVVEKINAEIEKGAKNTRSELATGGMATKIQAAKKCVSSGIAVIIANGQRPSVLKDVFDGNFKGTLFLPEKTNLSTRKKWIAFVSHVRGSITVDDGAKEAILKKGKSLLCSGIVDVQGDFKSLDTISVKDASGIEIARGVTEYSSEDLLKVRGRKSGEIEVILGGKACDEAIHKDNLVRII